MNSAETVHECVHSVQPSGDSLSQTGSCLVCGRAWVRTQALLAIRNVLSTDKGLLALLAGALSDAAQFRTSSTCSTCGYRGDGELCGSCRGSAEVADSYAELGRALGVTR